MSLHDKHCRDSSCPGCLPPPLPPLGQRLDEVRLLAASLLVGHTGARDLEFGYLHDGVPLEQADWWATANYGGTKLTVEHKTGPVEAVEGLAIRLLTGAKCRWCQGLVALNREGAVAYPGGPMLDGTTMPEDPADIAKLGQCLWRRNGRRWEPGCLHGASTAPAAPRDRAARRRLNRAYEATRPGGRQQ